MSPGNLSDAELAQHIAKNESWALSEMYDRYARLVFSLSLKLLNDRSGAEEVVQEVFTKVWRSASLYSPERGKFSSWLLGIAHNQCIDELRRRKARPVTESTDEEPFREIPADDDPAEAAAYTLEQERIRRALQQIPTEQRVALELAYFEGLTQQEIAVKCGEPLGTVKTRIRLGMLKLKELLKE
ncbi:MAG: sigma-70 family RNA polymerase sigma factor [Rudaea sp.]